MGGETSVTAVFTDSLVLVTTSEDVSVAILPARYEGDAGRVITTSTNDEGRELRGDQHAGSNLRRGVEACG